MYLTGTKQIAHEIRKKKRPPALAHKLPTALLPHSKLVFHQKAQNISDPTCVNQSSCKACISELLGMYILWDMTRREVDSINVSILTAHKPFLWYELYYQLLNQHLWILQTEESTMTADKSLAVAHPWSWLSWHYAAYLQWLQSTKSGYARVRCSFQETNCGSTCHVRWTDRYCGTACLPSAEPQYNTWRG